MGHGPSLWAWAVRSHYQHSVFRTKMLSVCSDTFILRRLTCFSILKWWLFGYLDPEYVGQTVCRTVFWYVESPWQETSVWRGTQPSRLSGNRIKHKGTIWQWHALPYLYVLDYAQKTVQPVQQNVCISVVKSVSCPIRGGSSSESANHLQPFCARSIDGRPFFGDIHPPTPNSPTTAVHMSELVTRSSRNITNGVTQLVLPVRTLYSFLG